MFINDNTLKSLGIDYQKLIALEYCLNAKKNHTIWIECKGDVATENTSTEVKHHIDGGVIIDNSEDVWKTIKNYTVNFDVIKQYSNLVLHTTAVCRDNSIFYNWNDLKVTEKYAKLKSHTPSTTLKPIYDEVLKFDKEKLETILGKFIILEGQKNISEKWDELKEHSKFTIIPDNFRDTALQQLYGYITKMAIDNANEWKVIINDFNRDIQDKLSPYTKGNTPFPVVSVAEIDKNSEKQKFIFIEKMKSISIKEKDQTNAIRDYLRANLSQIKLLETTPTLTENLEEYDSNVKRSIEDVKSKNCIGVTKEHLDTNDVHMKSQNTYFECITNPHDPIVGVNDTQKYYRDGRIHHTLEETDFEWKYNDSDI